MNQPYDPNQPYNPNQPYDPNQQWGQPQHPAPPDPGQQWQQPAQPYAQPDPGQQWAQPAQPDPNQQWAQPQQPNPAHQWGQQPASGAAQGFTAPGAFGPPPKSGGNGKMIALIVGGIAVVAAIGLTLFLVLGGGRSAEETVTAWMDAAVAGDPVAAKALSCPAADDKIGDDESSGPNNMTYSVDSVTENGDTASATVSVVAEGTPATISMTLEKNSDGDFEVCDYTITPD